MLSVPQTGDKKRGPSTNKVKKFKSRQNQLMCTNFLLPMMRDARMNMDPWKFRQCLNFQSGSHSEESTPEMSYIPVTQMAPGVDYTLSPSDPIYLRMGFVYKPALNVQTFDSAKTRVKEDAVAVEDVGDELNIYKIDVTPVPFIEKHMGYLGGLCGSGIIGPGELIDPKLTERETCDVHEVYTHNFGYAVTPAVVNAVALRRHRVNPHAGIAAVWTVDKKTFKVKNVRQEKILFHLHKEYNVSESSCILKHLVPALLNIQNYLEEQAGTKLRIPPWTSTTTDQGIVALMSFLAQLTHSLISLSFRKDLKYVNIKCDTGNSHLDTLVAQGNYLAIRLLKMYSYHPIIHKVTGPDDPVLNWPFIGSDGAMILNITIFKALRNLSAIIMHAEVLGSPVLSTLLEQQNAHILAQLTTTGSISSRIGTAWGTMVRDVVTAHRVRGVMLLDDVTKMASYILETDSAMRVSRVNLLPVRALQEIQGVTHVDMLHVRDQMRYTGRTCALVKFEAVVRRVCDWTFLEDNFLEFNVLEYASTSNLSPDAETDVKYISALNWS